MPRQRSSAERCRQVAYTASRPPPPKSAICCVQCGAFEAHTHACACTQICTRTRTHANTHTHTHTHTKSHTHTYVCLQAHVCMYTPLVILRRRTCTEQRQFHMPPAMYHPISLQVQHLDGCSNTCYKRPQSLIQNW